MRGHGCAACDVCLCARAKSAATSHSHSRAPPHTGVVWGLFTPPLWTLSLVSFGTMIAYALLGVEDTRNDPDYDYSAWTEAILNVTATGKAVVASALRLG